MVGGISCPGRLTTTCLIPSSNVYRIVILNFTCYFRFRHYIYGISCYDSIGVLYISTPEMRNFIQFNTFCLTWLTDDVRHGWWLPLHIIRSGPRTVYHQVQVGVIVLSVLSYFLDWEQCDFKQTCFNGVIFSWESCWLHTPTSFWYLHR